MKPTLVVFSAGFTPGLRSFLGEVIVHPGTNQREPTLGRMHVAVVWCCNSAMEIAYDLATHAGITSMVVRRSVSTIFILYLIVSGKS
jgi:cation diffusion facilitator CzcD-associated flavoprotein CzcO